MRCLIFLDHVGQNNLLNLIEVHFFLGRNLLVLLLLLLFLLRLLVLVLLFFPLITLLLVS